MSDMVLRLLHAIREDVAGLRADLAEVKERLGLLEGSAASLSRRMDRIGGDLEYVKRRLDLTGPPSLSSSPAAPR